MLWMADLRSSAPILQACLISEKVKPHHLFVIEALHTNQDHQLELFLEAIFSETCMSSVVFAEE